MDIDKMLDDSIQDIEPGKAADSLRRVMNIYYLIDTSSSMRNSGKIDSINQVMPDVVNIVKEISDSNADTAEIKISALTFNTGSQWMYSAPLSAHDFKWMDCKASGLTDLGHAYKNLEEHLHRAKDLGESQGHFAPAIILLTDGAPNDNYTEGFNVLSKNKWFKHAIRIAIAIGTGCDNDVLRQFVGENARGEAIITVNDREALKTLIRTVTCSVSKIGSSNSSSDNKSTQDLVTEEIHDTLSNTNDVTIDINNGVINVPPMGDDIFD